MFSKYSISFSSHRTISILFIFGQFTNTPPPIEVTEEGIVICVNDEHPLKAEFPIEVTEEEIVICVNDEQL